MTTTIKDLDTIIADGYIDTRDLIERLKELEDAEVDGSIDIVEEEQELSELRNILDDLKGNGADEQFRGDWYPITLIPEIDFEDYARELADDIGAINSNASWPLTHIDWPAAARELSIDYISIDIRGVEYLYR